MLSLVRLIIESKLEFKLTHLLNGMLARTTNELALIVDIFFRFNLSKFYTIDPCLQVYVKVAYYMFQLSRAYLFPLQKVDIGISRKLRAVYLLNLNSQTISLSVSTRKHNVNFCLWYTCHANWPNCLFPKASWTLIVESSYKIQHTKVFLFSQSKAIIINKLLNYESNQCIDNEKSTGRT